MAYAPIKEERHRARHYPQSVDARQARPRRAVRKVTGEAMAAVREAGALNDPKARLHPALILLSGPER
ncbi:MAG TPA: hypothetical protein VFR66_16395 [Burkholderiales bacterium]|nr:hypothetical protein [Burkholderiales bacterium]